MVRFPFSLLLDTGKATCTLLRNGKAVLPAWPDRGSISYANVITNRGMAKDAFYRCNLERLHIMG
jgi:hypothetical protein